MNSDLYSVLGLDRGADLVQIKKAYRQLAIIHHPDKSKDSGEKFKELAHAYSILSDPETRKEYDLNRIEVSDSEPEVQQDRETGPDFSHFPDSYYQHVRNPDYDVEMECTISLAEAFLGIHKRVQSPVVVMCIACHGQGTMLGQDACYKCHGDRVHYQMSDINKKRVVSCGMCEGAGHVPVYKVCRVCCGRKESQPLVLFDVPKGITTGGQLKIPNEGHFYPDNRRRGDLVLIFRVEEDPHFTRINNDLYRHATISLSEALFGFSRILFTHLDSRPVAISNECGTILKPGYLHKIPKQGMPSYDSPEDYGDLYVQFNVEFPEKLNIPPGISLKTLKEVFSPPSEVIVIDDENEDEAIEQKSPQTTSPTGLSPQVSQRSTPPYQSSRKRSFSESESSSSSIEFVSAPHIHKEVSPELPFQSKSRKSSTKSHKPFNKSFDIPCSSDFRHHSERSPMHSSRNRSGSPYDIPSSSSSRYHSERRSKRSSRNRHASPYDIFGSSDYSSHSERSEGYESHKHVNPDSSDNRSRSDSHHNPKEGFSNIAETLSRIVRENSQSSNDDLSSTSFYSSCAESLTAINQESDDTPIPSQLHDFERLSESPPSNDARSEVFVIHDSDSDGSVEEYSSTEDSESKYYGNHQ
ncbi:hypothetical protein BDB01DRAFT_228130 [Pilobolus umbonatus]|nr:hypothetical protein BDB01DRAFT_228130 [Pilobolus umbonatus]